MLKKIKRKLSDLRNILIIKNSKYFDEEYYLKENKDVKKGFFSPAIHYYYIGAKEGRNPSEIFNHEKYITMNSNFQIDINPVVHYMRFGQYDQRIFGPETYIPPKTVSKLLEENFFENRPFKTIPSKIDNKRLNIVFNGFDKSCFFGGKATALILAIEFVTTYDYDLRIISQNPVESVFYEFLELFNLPEPKKVEFFATDSNQYLPISNNDDFLCTMWSNADAVINTKTITGKIYYIMQEVETFFYDHGDLHLRCYNTLSNERLIPIVNSKLLYDYLCKNGYSNVKNKGIYFEPVFSDELLKPNKNTFQKKKKYKLFYYARPAHQRNIFYFGLDNLNESFISGKLNPDEWIVYTAGDLSMPNFCFDVDVEIKKLGVMDWKKYCEFMSSIDLCYSMIYTPHPSYPPLDAVTAGAVSVTNNYANKQNLKNYSNNIISSNLTKKDMLEALEKGANLAKNMEQRKKNWEDTNTQGKWHNTFIDVVKYMKEYQEEK